MKSKKILFYSLEEDTSINSIVSEPEIPYQISNNYKEFGHLSIHDNDNLQFWKSLGINEDISTDATLLKLIKIGVSKKTLQKLLETMDITLEEMADLLHTTDRTLRRYNEDTILNTEQSERILELAKLYNYGITVFGNIKKFKLWMNDSIMALGNHQPKKFLDTSLGINMLTQLLGRIQYGVYS